MPDGNAINRTVKMKRFIVFITFSLLLTGTSKSQILIAMVFGDQLNTPKLEFGLNVGANLSSLSGLDEAKYNPDVVVGTYFMWKFHDRFQLQPELFFRYTGGARKLYPYPLENEVLDPLLRQSRVERTAIYFSLPVNLKYRIWKELRISVAPQASLLASAKDQFIRTGDEENELVYSLNSTSKLKKFDFGFSGGLSYKLKNGKGINLELRYYYGVLNTINDSGMPSSGNRIISMLVGIPIGAESDVVVESAD